MSKGNLVLQHIPKISYLTENGDPDFCQGAYQFNIKSSYTPVIHYKTIRWHY